jgi:hypothetical protein
MEFSPTFLDTLADDISASSCSRPILVDKGWVSCATGDPAKCRSCARLFRDDWRTIGLSGLSATRAYYWITLTLGSFGPIHFVPKHDSSNKRRCECGRFHPSTLVGLRGVPVHPESYDYLGQLHANRDASKLWNNTLAKLHRALDFEHLVAKEVQARGALHFHALLAPTDNGLPLSCDEILSLLKGVTSQSGVTGEIRSWGNIDVKAIEAEAASDTANTRGVVEYAIKSVISYALKGQGAAGPAAASIEQRGHRRRLDLAATRVPCSPSCVPNVCRQRVHRALMIRRQPVGVSRGWSVGDRKTRAILRQARADWVIANPEFAKPAMTADTAERGTWAAAWRQARLEHPDDVTKWPLPHQLALDEGRGDRSRTQAR